MSQQPGYNPYFNQGGGQPYPPPGGQQYPPPGGVPPPYGFQGGPQPGGPQGGGPPPFMPPPPVHQAFGPGAGGQGGLYGGSPHDVESNFIKTSNLMFDNKSVRAAFVRKVFMLLTVMLAIVVAMIALFLFEPNCRYFVRKNPWVYFLSYAVFMISYFAIICCESVRRNFPGNLICLLVITVSMGYMTAMISAYYNVEIVFLAMGICAVSCGAIMLFSCQTKYDFTSWIGVMFVISLVLFFFGLTAIIVSSFFPKLRFMYVIYAGLAALVFMVFLAIDTQMIIGGKRYEMSPEEYILAAIQLFLDIIYIFIYLLQIIGFLNKS